MTEHKTINPYDEIVKYPKIISDSQKLEAYKYLYNHGERILTEEAFKHLLNIFIKGEIIISYEIESGCFKNDKIIKKIKIITDKAETLEYSRRDIIDFIEKELKISCSKVF